MNFKVVGVAHVPDVRETVTLHGENGDELLLVTNPGHGLAIGTTFSVTVKPAEPAQVPKEESDASSEDAAT